MNELKNIEKTLFERFPSQSLPINIFDLLRKHQIETLISKEKNNDFKAKLFTAREMLGENMDENDPIFFVILYTQDALEQRLLGAYYLANFLMFYHHIIDVDRIITSLMNVDAIPTGDAYYLALSLLCPEKDVEMLLHEFGYNKSNYKLISDYSPFAERFLVSPFDFATRLNFMFERDGKDE